jgi:hypothetical protein
MSTSKIATAPVNATVSTEELAVMSKTDLVLVKTTIVIFTVVLNICFFNLFM